MISLAGRGKRLDDIDLPILARTIGCGEDEVHALIDVESAGTGFHSDGRLRILFERHKFYKFLSGRQRDEAVRQGLAVAKWRQARKSYNMDQHELMERARKINDTAALCSASYGLFQIMGFNHASIGYNTVQDMVVAFAADEEKHLEGAIAYLKANKLDVALRNHDWRAVAEGWNGAGYEQNDFHNKLRRAYEKWSRIKDTVVPQAPVGPPPKEVEEVLTNVAAKGRVSKTKTVAVLVGVAGAAKPVADISQQLSRIQIPEWLPAVLTVVVVAGAAFIFYERVVHGNGASKALAKLKGWLG